jgi:hypothetical protein
MRGDDCSGGSASNRMSPYTVGASGTLLLSSGLRLDYPVRCGGPPCVQVQHARSRSGSTNRRTCQVLPPRTATGVRLGQVTGTRRSMLRRSGRLPKETRRERNPAKPHPSLPPPKLTPESELVQLDWIRTRLTALGSAPATQSNHSPADQPLTRTTAHMRRPPPGLASHCEGLTTEEETASRWIPKTLARPRTPSPVSRAKTTRIRNRIPNGTGMRTAAESSTTTSATPPTSP